MKNTKNQSSKIVNNTLSDNSHYILYNSSNYKPSIENSVSEILKKLIKMNITAS